MISKTALGDLVDLALPQSHQTLSTIDRNPDNNVAVRVVLPEIYEESLTRGVVTSIAVLDNESPHLSSSHQIS